jgi:hypothetical protein
MIQPNSILPSIDPDANRRRALAKVYSLLLRLAEEAENTSIISDNPATEEKSDAIGQENLSKEV